MRVVQLGGGRFEERTVRLGPDEHPELHALLRKLSWLDQRLREI